MNKIYLLLGSNMGNSHLQLQLATKLIEKNVGKIIRKSSFYQTAAWGNREQPDFLNQVIVLQSTFGAEKCIEVLLSIEEDMGRIRSTKNAPRLIDIDILYFNKEIIDLPELQVPHPAIQLRRFVLAPLNELSPNFIHPGLGKSNHQLLIECPDVLNVKKI